MVVLHQSILGESCLAPSLMLWAVGLFVGAILAGSFLVTGIRGRRILAAFFLAPQALLVGFALHLTWTGEPSNVLIALDGDALAYRYCRALTLHDERIALRDLVDAAHRREVVSTRQGRRVHHDLDLVFAGRPEPVTVSLDALTDDAVRALEALAPEAMAEFARSR